MTNVSTITIYPARCKYCNTEGFIRKLQVVDETSRHDGAYFIALSCMACRRCGLVKLTGFESLVDLVKEVMGLDD